MIHNRFIPLMALLPLALANAGCGFYSMPQESGQRGLNDSPPVLTVEKLENAERVLAIVEPAAESVCNSVLPNRECDLVAAIADESDQSLNAYQIGGQTTIVFTRPLLAHFRNDHELAFVYAHEAAHYILRHHQKNVSRQVLGGLILGGVAASQGVEVKAGFDLGADFGRLANRAYSPKAEFEADRLGAEITLLAGYDPLIGVLVFDYLPEAAPNAILPSHPPNKERIARIREFVAARAPARPAVPAARADSGAVDEPTWWRKPGSES